VTERPFQVENLDHVVVRVADVDRALGFYRDVLGCVPARIVERLGLHQLRAGRSMIDLIDAKGPLGDDRQGRNMDHFAIRIEPFDAAAIRAYLARHGIAAGEPEPRYGAEGSGPSIYITDPDGNIVELKGPPDDAAAGSD